MVSAPTATTGRPLALPSHLSSPHDPAETAAIHRVARIVERFARAAASAVSDEAAASLQLQTEHAEELFALQGLHLLELSRVQGGASAPKRGWEDGAEDAMDVKRVKLERGDVEPKLEDDDEEDVKPDVKPDIKPKVEDDVVVSQRQRSLAPTPAPDPSATPTLKTLGMLFNLRHQLIATTWTTEPLTTNQKAKAASLAKQLIDGAAALLRLAKEYGRDGEPDADAQALFKSLGFEHPSDHNDQTYLHFLLGTAYQELSTVHENTVATHLNMAIAAYNLALDIVNRDAPGSWTLLLAPASIRARFERSAISLLDGEGTKQAYAAVDWAESHLENELRDAWQWAAYGDLDEFVNTRGDPVQSFLKGMRSLLHLLGAVDGLRESSAVESLRKFLDDMEPLDSDQTGRTDAWWSDIAVFKAEFTITLAGWKLADWLGARTAEEKELSKGAVMLSVETSIEALQSALILASGPQSASLKTSLYVKLREAYERALQVAEGDACKVAQLKEGLKEVVMNA